MKNLFPDSLVLALEYVLKLHKGMRPVEIDFLGPNFKLGDHFVGDIFDTKFPVVLVNLSLDFVTWIIALQLVFLGEYEFLVPSLL